MAAGSSVPPRWSCGALREGLVTSVDGFTLAYDRIGSGPPVLLLHGWPGDRTDYRDLVPGSRGARLWPRTYAGSAHPTSMS
jgi:pimeloyl-ACP methyl ester carboxylesterase